VNPSKNVHDLLRMMKFDRVFDIEQDEASALNSFGLSVLEGDGLNQARIAISLSKKPLLKKGGKLNLFKASLVAIAIFSVPAGGVPNPGGGTVNGKVTFTGAIAKPKPLDLSKEPACLKIHSADALMPENVVHGSNNTLRNVVVYISGAASDATPASPGPPATFDQRDCHYTTHVLAVHTGQEIKISNSDPFAHNIHPLAKINREWNKMQLPNTPAFSYAYDQEEIIPVKCNIHPWMRGYFVVLGTSQFAVTGEDGRFSLPNLPSGHYVVTAWHETFGTQSREFTISADESQTIDFVFKANP
jgi:plastocyanin